MIEEIYNNLDSIDPKIRNKAAIDLIDIIEISKNKLIKQIINEKNKDSRGTLIYALGHLICSDNFMLLFDLLINSNYEVFNEAYDIIKTQRFCINDSDIKTCIEKYNEFIKNIDKYKFCDNEKQERLDKIKDIYNEFLF
jgi:hypothetical protein